MFPQINFQRVFKVAAVSTHARSRRSFESCTPQVIYWMRRRYVRSSILWHVLGSRSRKTSQ